MVVAIGFWGFAIAAIVGTWRLWNAPVGHRSYEKPLWWVWPESFWNGYRRAQLALALMIVAFAIGLTVPNRPGLYVALSGIAVSGASLVAIVLFNRPHFLVPPACRNDPGVWRRVRKGTSKKDSPE